MYSWMTQPTRRSVLARGLTIIYVAQKDFLINVKGHSFDLLIALS